VSLFLLVGCGQTPPTPPTSGTAGTSSATDSAQTITAAPTSPTPGSPSEAPASTSAVASAPPGAIATQVATYPVNATGLVGGPSAVYAWDETAGTLDRIDLATGAIASATFGDPKKTPLGTPKAAVVTPSAVWVTDVARHAIAELDPSSLAVRRRIALDRVPVGGSHVGLDPIGLAVSGDDAWVSDFDRGLVVRVSIGTGRVREVIRLDHPDGLAIAYSSVWITLHRLGEIARLDATTGKPLATIKLLGTGTNEVCGLCVEQIRPGPTAMWMGTSGGTQAIDPASNAPTVVDSTPALDVAVDGATVWATHVDLSGPPPCNDPTSSVSRLSTAAPNEIAAYALPCSFYVAVAGGDVWVATLGAVPAVVRLHPGG
jgi:hypothetical protein